ncbi:ADP-ribosylhydrolase ARH1-like [Haliotis asinina]|uniref:ADP-ribosylhydrolase ARH1-like n=1 Tax=Haliotis asinina TaxID=109174 RepID=UPI0035321E05
MATSSQQQNGVTMLERYKAAMVLAGAGDALGYKTGDWEFCYSTKLILEDLKEMGGLENINVNTDEWMVSDDTVMHLATGEALVSEASSVSLVETYHVLARMYKECMEDMAGRAPGATCIMMTDRLKPGEDDGYKIPFNKKGGGCGAAMRAMCIGLRYPRPEDLKDLIAVSIESGRMTHHHPTGYLGALASALFTAFSIQGKPLVEWGQGLLDVLPQALQYVVDSDHYPEENKDAWPYFKENWEAYVELRDLASGKPVFPKDYDDPEVRDIFYRQVSFRGWGGASGHDSTIIAYDANLGAGQDWKELCMRAMFHRGDNDSTGTIAACWYGAMYGFQGVPEGNYKNLEYRDRLERLAEKLYNLAHTRKDSQKNPEEMEGSNVDPTEIKKDSKKEDSFYSPAPGTDEGEDMEEPRKEDGGCKMDPESTNGMAE